MTKRCKTIIFLLVLLISVVGFFTIYSLSGKSIISKAESVLEKNETTEYFAVSGLKADKTLVNSVTLSWNVSSEAAGYNIFKYDDTTGEWIYIADTHKNNAEYTVVGLNGGCEYRFAVNGYSSDSGEIVGSAESLSEITAVTKLFDVNGIAAASSGGIYKISWNESAGADGYVIYYWDKASSSFVYGKKTLLTYSFIYESEEEIPKLIALKAYKYIGDTQTLSENYCTIDLTAAKKRITVYADGDSIAYGAGAGGYSYVDMLRDEYGFDVTKKAVSRSTIAQNLSDEEKDITKRILNNFNADYDYALIDGGVNDYYFSMPLGEVTDPSIDEFDTATTCGGLEAIFYYIREISPETRIYFLVTHKINNFDSTENKLGLTYLDYYNAILKVCDKYCVTVIDCHEDHALNTSDKTAKKAYTVKTSSFPDGDGIHPNLEGYKKYYMPKILSALKMSR